MGITFWIDLFARGLKFWIQAYGKIFKDILTNSLKELSQISPEYEPLAKCLLEIIDVGSIKIECLPESDKDYLKQLISKVKDSEFFNRYCDASDYTDEKLREALKKFFKIYEDNLPQDQKLFNKLQLEYNRKLLQTTGKAEKNTEDIKSDLSGLQPKVDQILAAVSSKENVKANAHIDPEGYKSKHLDSVFALAFELMNNGKFRKALRKYKEFLKEKDSNLHRKYFACLNNIAVIYLELRNYKNAVRYAELSHRIAPKKSLPFLNLAVACFYLRNLERALEYAQKAMRRRINDPNAYNTLSIIYAEKGERAKAYQFINNAIKKDKKFAPAYVNRAILYAHQHKYQRALEDVSRAIELEPQNGDFFVHLGVAYQKKLFSLIQSKVFPLGTKGDIHIFDYEKLDKLTQEENKLLDEARESYEKALKLGVKIQDNLTLGMNLADCHHMKKEYKAAEKIYKQIRVKDERDYPYQGLGDVYFWTGRFKKALICYRKVIALHGENPHTCIWIARTLAELDDFDGAIENLHKGIRLDPKNPRYKFNLGLMYEKTNRLQKAQITFFELKESGFDLGPVCYNLGNIYFRQQMYSSAKLEFLEAKKAGSPRDLYSELLAVSAAVSDNRDIAKEEFEYLVSVNPDNFVYNFNYARILDMEGEGETAKKYYVKALTSKEIKKYPRLSLWIPKRLYDIGGAKSKIIIPRIGI